MNKLTLLTLSRLKSMVLEVRIIKIVTSNPRDKVNEIFKSVQLYNTLFTFFYGFFP